MNKCCEVSVIQWVNKVNAYKHVERCLGHNNQMWSLGIFSLHLTKILLLPEFGIIHALGTLLRMVDKEFLLCCVNPKFMFFSLTSLLPWNELKEISVLFYLHDFKIFRVPQWFVKLCSNFFIYFKSIIIWGMHLHYKFHKKTYLWLNFYSDHNLRPILEMQNC